jgi:hypothetical protein
MVRLLEIPFGNHPFRRSTTPSSRTRLGIWFSFLLGVNLSDAYGSTRPRVQQMERLSYTKPGLFPNEFGRIQLALAIVTANGWEVHHMGVKNSFLHGDLSEEIYMEQPRGFMKESSFVF